MKWKDVVIVVLLLGMVAGFFYSRHATEKINNKLHHADSLRIEAEHRYQRQLWISAKTDSANAELAKAAKAKGKAADQARDSSRTLEQKLKADTTTRDSLKHAIQILAQKDAEIAPLRSHVYLDSLHILNITKDRDLWKSTADSLQRANLRIYRDAADIAATAKHEVNLGFVRVPREVVAIALSTAGGYLLCKATCPDKK